MEFDATALAKLAELKRQLETISGAAIDAIPVGLASVQDGIIMSRTLFPPGEAVRQRDKLQLSSM